MLEITYIQVSEILLCLSEKIFPSPKDSKDRFRFLAFCALLQSKGRYEDSSELYSPYLKKIYAEYKTKIDGFKFRYIRYIDILIKNGHLKKTKNYSTFTKKCNSYKLSESIISSKMVSVGIVFEKDKRFWERYTKSTREMTEYENKVAAHIKSHTTLDTKKVFELFIQKHYPTIHPKIDYSASDIIEKIENFIRLDCVETSKQKKERKKKRAKRLSKQLRKFRNAIQSLKQMDSSVVNVKVDKFGERLHSPLTRMNKFIRGFIQTPSGEYFHEIDAKNCQPFLIAYILKCHNYDVDENFIIDTQEGRFNDNFETMMGDRDRAKKQLLRDLFYAKKNFIRFISKAGDSFRSLYPKTFDAIIHFTKKDKKRLCKEAQRLESKIFIKRVYGELLEKNIPAFTIHDCIATPQEYVSVVEKMILSAFDSLCGMTPKLKTTEYNI